MTCIFDLLYNAVFAPQWFNNLFIPEDTDVYVIFFRFIYPKWLSLNNNTHSYTIIIKQQYRHIQYERKRLNIGVMIKG